MQEHYDRLGVSVGATPEEIKAAYHIKLKEYPAHQYPQEFKAIRLSYEALKKGGQKVQIDYLKARSAEVEVTPASLQSLRERAMAAAEVSLEELIRLTF